jgi:hypothetical protein
MFKVRRKHPIPQSEVEGGWKNKTHVHTRWRAFGPLRPRFIGKRHAGIIRATLEALDALDCSADISIRASKDDLVINGAVLAWDSGSERIAQEAASLISEELRIINTLDLSAYELEVECKIERIMLVTGN